MNLGKLVQDPRFANENEKAFSLFSVRENESKVSDTYFRLAQISWMPMVVIWFFGLSRLPEVWMLGLIQVVKSIVCLGFLLLKPRVAIKRGAVFVLLLATQLSWAAVAIMGPSGGRLDRYVVGVWIALLFFGNAFMPLRSYAHNFLFLISIASSHFALQNYFERDLASLLIALALLLGQNYAIYAHRMVKLSAISRYREQARYIPKKVLFTAEEMSLPLTDVFPPASRYCVCVCSDWRGFQALAKTMPMERLGSSLADYYQSLLEQLNQVLPDGNFFFDWIADELFLVVFGMDRQSNASVARSALVAARRVIEFRYQFFAERGYPVGVDVGVSSGVAAVGVYTSGAVVKATAFGNTPGEARKLQDIAKGLRAKHRSIDRIVMSKAFAADAGLSSDECGVLTDDAGAEVLVWPDIAS